MIIAVDKAQKDGKHEMKKFDPSEKNYSVYVHVFPNGKLYIGSTRQIPTCRWRKGSGYRNCKTMNDAISEFGWDNIQHIVLFDGLEQQEAMSIERELIKKYHTQDPAYGYNTKNGGQYFNDHSEEFLESLRNRMIGNKYSAGRKMSDSHKEALRKANLGHNRTPTFLGKHHTEETKEILSKSRKDSWKDPEYRKHVTESLPDMSGKNNPMYGRKQSDETKAKISAKNKGWNPPEEWRKRHSECNSKPVYALDESMQIVAEYPSIKKAAEAVGACKENIGFCCRNPNRTCRKYYWRYKESFDADRSG